MYRPVSLKCSREVSLVSSPSPSFTSLFPDCRSPLFLSSPLYSGCCQRRTSKDCWGCRCLRCYGAKTLALLRLRTISLTPKFDRPFNVFLLTSDEMEVLPVWVTLRWSRRLWLLFPFPWAGFRPSAQFARQLIQDSASQVMAKSRIGHIVEAEILQAIGADYIDEYVVLRFLRNDSQN